MSELADRLYDIFSSSKFLNMEGLANEVPIFIQTYDASEEDQMAALSRALGSRLQTNGIKIAEINLFNLLLDELRQEGLLEDLIADEQDYESEDLFQTLINYADPSSRLAHRLAKEIQNPDIQMTFITGVGHIFPFLRTHTLLDSIQPIMMDHPLVLFFPGEYTQVQGLGSQLRLFGKVQSKGYYRAFNLDHYHTTSK